MSDDVTNGPNPRMYQRTPREIEFCKEQTPWYRCPQCGLMTTQPEYAHDSCDEPHHGAHDWRKLLEVGEYARLRAVADAARLLNAADDEPAYCKARDAMDAALAALDEGGEV